MGGFTHMEFILVCWGHSNVMWHKLWKTKRLNLEFLGYVLNQCIRGGYPISSGLDRVDLVVNRLSGCGAVRSWLGDFRASTSRKWFCDRQCKQIKHKRKQNIKGRWSCLGVSQSVKFYVETDFVQDHLGNFLGIFLQIHSFGVQNFVTNGRGGGWLEGKT